MRKNFYPFIGLPVLGLCLLSACERADGVVGVDGGHVPDDGKMITFVVDEMEVSKDFVTRALSDDKVTDIEVYDDGVLLLKQKKGDSDFGSPTIELTYGAHTLVFVAHRCEGASITDGVWKVSKVKDTYISKFDLSVTTATASSQTVELSRANYQLCFLIQDALPSSVAKASVEIGEYYDGVRLADLSGVGGDEYECSIDVSTLQGVSGVSLVVSGFAPVMSEEYAADVSVSFMRGSGGVVQSHVKSGVPLQAGYKTTIKGNYFQTSPEWEITIDESWGEKSVLL